MSLDSNQKALLVDFGGVLTTDIWSSFAAFCEQRGLDAGAAKQLFRGDPDALATLRGLETGEVEPAAFERRFAALLGTEPDGLVEGLFAGLQPDQPMLEAVGQARDAGVPTGLISNSWAMDHYTDEIRSLFDEVVISAEVGLHKPQPEIYLLAAVRLDVAPEDCVFVDDLRENCAGAEAVGMTAVLHRDAAETISRIEELLGVKLATK
jgi:haloacid dehalogenase superfamily, subfamily IA, variant 3 with third motif having DD or ED/haloacid dehalogenase superfamily, subfamily IA, variant 1 with third motif having Dx(3-4)D or Dx(3-4)E